MKMKRFLAVSLASVMCFMLISCQNSKDDKERSEIPSKEQTTENTDISKISTVTPLLYRVTDKSGNVIWLFGSIHVGREDYYPLPDYVLDAFENADGLAVELDMLAFEKDMKLQIQALSQLVYYDGSKIKDHIPQELYEDAVEILEQYNTYVAALDSYCPAFWGSMINSLMLGEMDADANLGIDRYLLEQAYEDEKEIIEIESAKLQYGLLADFDDDVQLMLLESSIESYENKDEAADDLNELMDIWASGDESAFAEYQNASDDTMTDEEKQTYEKYIQAMKTDRNLSMTDYAEEALQDGEEIFICVGAAHVVGDGAMADLLAERGYTIECITR